MAGTDLNAVSAAFSPLNGAIASTVAIVAASTSSQFTTLPQAQSGQPADYVRQIQVYNANTVPVFVGFAKGSATAIVPPGGATPGSYPVAPGATVTITVEGNPLFAVAITASGGGAGVYFTPGTGR
jgi:hypothetical protein